MASFASMDYAIKKFCIKKTGTGIIRHSLTVAAESF